MAYPTIHEIKAYIGITSSTYDNFLAIQLAAVIDAVEQYCQRKFELAADSDEWPRAYGQYDFMVSRYPLATVTGMTVDDETYDYTTGRIQESIGILSFDSSITGDVVIEYTGGFSTIPGVVNQVIYDAVKAQYDNVGTNGVTGPVKSERIDGVATISYFAPDAGASPSAASASPLIMNYVGSLDPYMSERAIGGTT